MHGRYGAWLALDGVAFLIAILTLALIALVVLVVGAPLRRARTRPDAGSDAHEDRRQPSGVVSVAPGAHTHDELEAAREAKYREIRDAELDFRTGKLSPEDYEAIDAELRAEAIEILDQIEQGTTRGQSAASDPTELPDAPEV